MRPLAFPLAPLAVLTLCFGGCDAGETNNGFPLDPITVTYDFIIDGSDLQDGSQGVNAEDEFNVEARIQEQDFGTADVVAARVLDNGTAQLTALAGSDPLTDLDEVTLELGGGGEEPVDVASATDLSGGNSIDLDVESNADLTDIVRSGLIPAALRVEAADADADATYRVTARLRLQIEVEGS